MATTAENLATLATLPTAFPAEGADAALGAIHSPCQLCPLPACSCSCLLLQISPHTCSQPHISPLQPQVVLRTSMPRSRFRPGTSCFSCTAVCIFHAHCSAKAINCGNVCCASRDSFQTQGNPHVCLLLLT